ncbi:MAG: HNH endonuclease [Planctomycetota bacterium]|nr:HNH endonuclease [Planctomycetota bacterium]
MIPRKHGGGDETENLALACIDCNLHKGSNLTGIDPVTGEVTELFNPRRQIWMTHFRTRSAFIEGITAVGRTTVRVLDMNAFDRVEHRLETVAP